MGRSLLPCILLERKEKGERRKEKGERRKEKGEDKQKEEEKDSNVSRLFLHSLKNTHNSP